MEGPPPLGFESNKASKQKKTTNRGRKYKRAFLLKALAALTDGWRSHLYIVATKDHPPVCAVVGTSCARGNY